METIKDIMKSRSRQFGNCFLQTKGREKVFTPFFIVRNICYGIEANSLAWNIVKLNADLPVWEFQKEVSNLFRDHRLGKFLWGIYFKHHRAGIIADIDSAISKYEVTPGRKSFWDYTWPARGGQFERAILKSY